MPRFDENIYTNTYPFILKKDIVYSPTFYTQIPNWHDDIEIEYIKEGEAFLYIDGKKFLVQAGSFVFIPPNAIHQLVPTTNVKYSCLLINPQFFRSIESSENIASPFFDEELTEIFLQFESLASALDSPHSKMKIYYNLFKQFIILNERHTSLQETIINNTPHQTKIKEAIIYIRNHFSEKLTLDNIAGRVYMSKFDFSRRFKDITNMTVIEFINYYRCKIAASKISEGFSVCEAALSSGFENMSYFTKTFKKYFHRSPSQYKHKK